MSSLGEGGGPLPGAGPRPVEAPPILVAALVTFPYIQGGSQEWAG